LITRDYVNEFVKSTVDSLVKIITEAVCIRSFIYGASITGNNENIGGFKWAGSKEGVKHKKIYG
jgi:hypothetical protein